MAWFTLHVLRSWRTGNNGSNCAVTWTRLTRCDDNLIYSAMIRASASRVCSLNGRSRELQCRKVASSFMRHQFCPLYVCTVSHFILLCAFSLYLVLRQCDSHFFQVVALYSIYVYVQYACSLCFIITGLADR